MVTGAEKASRMLITTGDGLDEPADWTLFCRQPGACESAKLLQ